MGKDWQPLPSQRAPKEQRSAEAEEATKDEKIGTLERELATAKRHELAPRCVTTPGEPATLPQKRSSKRCGSSLAIAVAPLVQRGPGGSVSIGWAPPRVPHQQVQCTDQH